MSIVALEFHEATVPPDTAPGTMVTCIILTKAVTGRDWTMPAYYLNAYPLEYEDCICASHEAHGENDGCPTTGWFYEQFRIRQLLPPRKWNCRRLGKNSEPGSRPCCPRGAMSAHLSQVPGTPPPSSAELKALLRQSVVLCALENLMKLDTDPVLRAAARARYLDLTDGRLPQ